MASASVLRSLRNAAVDLSATRGTLLVSGRDANRLLHDTVTNDVRALRRVATADGEPDSVAGTREEEESLIRMSDRADSGVALDIAAAHELPMPYRLGCSPPVIAAHWAWVHSCLAMK